MSAMIERVAQAIYEVEPYERSIGVVISWDDVQESQKEGFRVRARAAVAAIHEIKDVRDQNYDDDFVGYGSSIRPRRRPTSWFAALIILALAAAGLWIWFSEAWR
jgi:hypothetical protein